MDPLQQNAGSDSHLSPTPPEGDEGPNHLPTAGRPKAESAPSVPPFVLGQYRVVEKIGEGGMGAVYRALHGRLKKAVALKVLPPGHNTDPHSVSRFEREMEAIGRLNHNNIVRATDAGEADGVHYLVMELIDGIDLARLVRLAGPLPVAAACELMRQAAVGLQYAHENGLVHRDVKPSNLLLSVNGELKITDLGLALLSRSELASGELTVTGQVMGTADYMAPEQWENSHAVDIRADLYSLGCTLYTLLAGRPPFAGPKHRSALRKMAAHAKELVPPITDHRADVPAPVEELRRRLMAKEPADRPADPAEVARTLEPFCGGADLAALARATLARPRAADAPAVLDRLTETRNAEAVLLSTPACGQTVTAGLVPRPRPHRRPWAAVGGALLLFGGLAASYWLWPWAPERTPAGPRPVPAAAQAPVPPDVGGWQNLLTKPPGLTFWEPGFPPVVAHEPKKEIVSIQSGGPSLLPLGTTDARHYTLDIGLRQVPWTGNVGVYFGGRPTAGRDLFHFQLIDLRHPDVTKPKLYYLGRSTGLIRQVGAAPPEMGLQGVLGFPLPNAPNNSECRLELEVLPDPSGLSEVVWDGLPCLPLIDRDGRIPLSDPLADARGEFGIFCNGAAVIVTEARIKSVK